MILSRGLLIVCLLAADAASADEALRPLSDAQWNAADTDELAFLTATPGECLASASAPDDQYRMEIGRAAFSSPFVFGGPAARSSLSCNSCHRDGHGNPDFFLDGLSSAPGTADVTSSLFSKIREDHVFNPMAIPTLIDIGRKDSFGETAPQPSIHAFVASAVTDEFQGVASPSVIDGIAAYVAQLDSDFCPEGETPQSVSRAFGDIGRIVRTAEHAVTRGDDAAADFLLLSAQHQLGLVHERFQGRGLAEERKRIADLSMKLAALRPAPGGGQGPDAAALRAIGERLGPLERRLRRKERRSLYNKERLRQFLARQKEGLAQAR